MKNYVNAIKNGLLAFWHAFRGHPLTHAREAHQAAIRTLCRADAEVSYQTQLIQYFDTEARKMDPHADWNLFAQLKDKWQEHVDERTLESRKYHQAQAKLDASKVRLGKLEPWS